MTAMNVQKWQLHPARALLVGVLTIGLGSALWRANPGAQSFDSGSDGSDGALVVPPSSGTIDFDPRDTTRWGRVLDLDGDGVFNFTTVTIGVNTNLRMTASAVARPIYWLATGNVTVTGSIILNGANAVFGTDLGSRRELPVPGSWRDSYKTGPSFQSPTPMWSRQALQSIQRPFGRRAKFGSLPSPESPSRILPDPSRFPTCRSTVAARLQLTSRPEEFHQELLLR